MKFRTNLLAVALSFGILQAQESPLSAPRSEIIALERQSDGVDLYIKENGGLDAYHDALRSMFGTALSAGTVTLEGLGKWGGQLWIWPHCRPGAGRRRGA